MRNNIRLTCAAAIAVLLFASNAHSHSGPFDGKEFKGRIAFSSDGNYNDEDDWGAFPVAIAMLDAFGVKDKLVHVDYCNILTQNDPTFYKEMVESILGAAERYDIDRSILFDCQTNLDGAVESIKNAINASSADNPLYYVLAGPMEVPYRGITKSNPDKRKYVYCISHSVWNDGYTRVDSKLHIHNKRDVIPSGINWIQCRDGNRNLAHSGGVGKRSTPEQWSLYYWLRDSGDARLRWIYSRLETEKRCDISDSTMTYFLLTGDEEANIDKLRLLLDGRQIPQIEKHRKAIRIEAENFRDLGGFKVEYGDRRASHRVNVGMHDLGTDSITTAFNDIYTVSGRYDVEVRYFDAKDGRSEFRLLVGGVQRTEPWTASADTGSWQSKTVADVPIKAGDEIILEVRGDGEEACKLDYVQLNYRAQISNASGSTTSLFSGNGPLDDPDVLPGQIIVVGRKPGYLKYNGGGPAFLCGPDNPETFLFLGDLNRDGTRSNGQQQLVIDRLIKSGANAFHCQMFRMRRCNIKDEGDDQHCPFVNFDPKQPLNDAILDQWDGWISRLEDAGVIIHLEF
ncbi:MAG: hypothetical protein OEW48_04815 [Phycisphaerae bacterium]|nr:hypothetical protein [Phycisphaerae bacterium]